MATYLRSVATSIAQEYKLALLDLDGVVYRGKNPVEYAADSINAAEAMGLSIEYTTNNSSRMQSVVAQQLQSFGLSVANEQIITSSLAATRMMARYIPAGSKVLVVGGEHLQDEVRKAGFTVVPNASEEPVAVVQGWYPDIDWHRLAEACYAIERGAQYFVTNLDTTIPREMGDAPGCGTFISAVVSTTGVQPVASAGKPESAMYDEARVLAAGGGEPVSVAQTLAVGDRLDTDIEAGYRGGYDSLAVLTGVTTIAELMYASEEHRPTYIVQDLRGLLEPIAAPTINEDGIATLCTEDYEITVSYNDERNAVKIMLNGNDITQENIAHAPYQLDVARAVCAFLWNQADCGVDTRTIAVPELQ